MRKKNYKGMKVSKRMLSKCKGIFPKEAYLFMVSEINEQDGTYAVWTSWNETSQSLNYGHYNLPSIEDYEKVFEEFYNNGK